MSETLADHFRANDGLVTFGELAGFGLGSADIRRRVRLGMLVREGPNLFSLAGYPVSIRHRSRRALLRVGERGVLAQRTAAHLLGFDRFGALSGPVDVVIVGSRSLKVPDVTIHRTRRLDQCDITDVAGLRCTSGARTIIDLAGICSEQALLHAIGSAIRDGRTSLDYLRRRLTDLRGPGRRGVAALDQVLSMMPGGGLHSTLEVTFLEISRSVIDLVPDTQVRLDASGTVYRVDAVYPGCPLVAEVDGHPVIRFTSLEVFREPGVVARDLRRALEPWFADRLKRTA